MRKGARKEVTQDELDESGIKDQSESGGEDVLLENGTGSTYFINDRWRGFQCRQQVCKR